MTSDPSWEEIQDRQISDSLKQIDGHDDDESPVVRLMSFSDDLIGEKHLTNAIAVFRRTQDFSVFDVGFGRGRLLAQIGGHFPNARLGGVDDNDDSLERARLLVPRSDLVKGPYRSAGGQHDFVVCSQVYEHVADTEDLLDALFDLTKPAAISACRHRRDGPIAAPVSGTSMGITIQRSFLVPGPRVATNAGAWRGERTRGRKNHAGSLFLTDLDLPPGYGSVDIEDFNGAGSVQSVAMGPRTGGLVSFLGPKLHHQRGWSRQNGVVVFMDGWSVQLIPGASAGMGYWKRAPYSTAAERARYVQRFSRHLERVERGPKY